MEINEEDLPKTQTRRMDAASWRPSDILTLLGNNFPYIIPHLAAGTAARPRRHELGRQGRLEGPVRAAARASCPMKGLQSLRETRDGPCPKPAGGSMVAERSFAGRRSMRTSVRAALVAAPSCDRRRGPGVQRPRSPQRGGRAHRPSTASPPMAWSCSAAAFPVRPHAHPLAAARRGDARVPRVRQRAPRASASNGWHLAGDTNCEANPQRLTRRWNPTEGMVPSVLPVESFRFTQIRGLSGDGSVVAGYGQPDFT